MDSTNATVAVDQSSSGPLRGQAATAPAAPEDLIREARRRQRRRRLLTGMAVVVVLGVVAGVIAGTAGHRPSRAGSGSHGEQKTAVRRVVGAPGPIPHSIGTTLLMWPVAVCGPSGGPPVCVDDLSTGRLTPSREPAIGVGDYQPLLARVGRWFVYVANGATAIRDDVTGRPRVLGTASFFAPAATPARVWLFQSRNGSHGPIRAWTVALPGGQPSQSITLPAGANLPADRGTDAGLLLQMPQGLALWSPGGAARTLPYSRDALGFDATARLVAYGTGCSPQAVAPNAPYEPNAGYYTCRMLRVFDVETGKLTSFAAPPGTGGWVPNGFNLVSAISHRSQLIAAYAATLPQGTGHVRLYVVRTTSPGRPTPVPMSAAFIFARTAWSASDSWLLYQGRGEHLWAYQVATGRIAASSTPCCQYTVMVAAPSGGG